MIDITAIYVPYWDYSRLHDRCCSNKSNVAVYIWKDWEQVKDYQICSSEATTLGEWCDIHGRNPIFKPTDDPHKKQKTRVHINLGIDNYLYIHTSLGSRRQKIQIRNIDYNYLSDEFGSQ